ncbi:MAG: TetR/AcrR family transcriptional regulator [Chloroflexi bacterium]|nr:MAG: TetR/AcrR family transcriptional regulator [Chloroflexota bacterium]MBL1196288.1 TetR/AcrR family transcriptional regulator [Chloroflexota bacterium]NOH13583.1 TetR/AcrR family transcriptional regulator [Chloroflexota bacterium]
MVRKLDPEKRAKFLKAALKLFVANGVQHTSTAAIAKEAGTAAGTLFLYFPTKQDLIHALILQVTEESSNHIKTLLEPSLSARDTFLTIWNGIIGWFLENMEAYHYQQQVRGSRMIEESVVQETARHLGYYFEAIQKGLEEGAIKSYPHEVIGEILYQDIVAVMNIISEQPDSAKQKEYIQIGFDIFWDGIKTADE